MDSHVHPSLSDVLEYGEEAYVGYQITREEISSAQVVKPGMCIECNDTPIEVFCEACGDEFCRLCFSAVHRKGSRARHTVKELKPIEAHGSDKAEPEESMAAEEVSIPIVTAEEVVKQVQAGATDVSLFRGFKQSLDFRFRSSAIPLRLTERERKILKLLQATLHVSEYTDKVDILSYRSKTPRIVEQLREVCATLSGVVVASDFKRGQALIKDKEFSQYQDFFREAFEVARRYKIMNPEMMRDQYGKLIYLLQDAVSPDVTEMLGFDMVKPIETVFKVLTEKGTEALLDDPLLNNATVEIMPEGRSRFEIQKQIRSKEKAVATLAKKYQNSELSKDDLCRIIYSIGDNNAFLRANRDPCERMLRLLSAHFPQHNPSEMQELGIRIFDEGARLNHDHSTHYQFVMQTLLLWREINNDMFRLWMTAEGDLLDRQNYYRLRDTGQGLNRVQSAPHVSRAMHSIISRAQTAAGSWVGSSVVHLGDHAVPNALNFIDKYTQVARILTPIITTVEKIQDICQNEELDNYVTAAFGDPNKACMTILRDFFRHAFDGSGADNFYDAGSCVDGRLTSAWNWCNQIEKKCYFPLFLLTGFVGFDGEFK